MRREEVSAAVLGMAQSPFRPPRASSTGPQFGHGVRHRPLVRRSPIVPSIRTCSLEFGTCGSGLEAKFLAAAARETTSDRFLGKCWKRLRCLCFERMPARRRARNHHRRLSTSFKDEWVSKLQTRSEGRTRDHATWREACFGGRPFGSGPTRRPSACAMSCLNSSRPSAHPPFVAARNAVMNSSSSFTSHRA